MSGKKYTPTTQGHEEPQPDGIRADAAEVSSFSDEHGQGGREARGASDTAHKTTGARGEGSGVGDDALTEAEKEELEYVRAQEAREEKARAWAARYRMTYDDAMAFVKSNLSESAIPDFPGARRAMAKYLRSSESLPPKWMMVTGFYPESECCYDLGDRRKRIRALYKATVLLIRRELKRHEIDPDARERSIYWDPVAQVCFLMEISSSKLTCYLKELTGLSLLQVIDGVKAESTRGKVRAAMKAFLAQRIHAKTDDGEGGRDARGRREQRTGAGLADKWTVWKALKKTRRMPEWTPHGWAVEMGFSSYRRMYRACMAVYRKTPHQIELEEIGALLKQEDSHDDTKAQRQDERDGFKEWTLEELQAELVAIGRYRELRS